MREEGVTVPQKRVIQLLGSAGPLGVKELAARMGVTVGTSSVLADRLQEAGLITRGPNPNDKRKKVLSLTAQGRAVWESHNSRWRELLNELTRGLDQGEIAQAAGLLQVLANRMHPQSSSVKPTSGKRCSNC